MTPLLIETALQRRRVNLLIAIAQAADEIAGIDRQLAILRSQELESILIESEKQAAEAMQPC